MKAFPTQAYFRMVDDPDAPFDIAGPFDWAPDLIDPSQYTNLLFDGRFHRGAGLGRFDSPRFNRLMRRTARLPLGPARYRAYGNLDFRLSRDAAPMVPVSNGKRVTLVSKRVGCIVLRQWLDLAAACLK